MLPFFDKNRIFALLFLLRGMFMKKGKVDYQGVLLILLGVISVFYNKAFLLNPFIMIVLFFSFYKGLRMYLLNSALMIGISMLISLNYGLEIGVVVISFLFSTCLFSLLIKKPEAKYYSLITLNLCFLIIALIFEATLETFCLSVANTLLQFIVVKSYESFWRGTQDKSHHATNLEKGVVIAFASIIGMFLEPVGLFTTRIVLLFVAMKLNNEVGAISIFISCIYTMLFQSYSFIVVAALYLPLLIVFVLKRFKIMMYVISSLVLLLLTPVPIYLNVSFYATFVSLLVYITIDNSKLHAIYDYFDEKFEFTLQESPSLIYANGQIQAMNKYISLAHRVEDVELPNPFDSLVLDTRKHVCEKCDHYSHCMLKDNLYGLFKDKLTSADRKLISEKCISPYKLTLSLSSNFKIYQKEKHYFNKCQEANSRYKYLIRSLEKPLGKCSLQLKKTQQNPTEQKILESGLHFYRMWVNNKNIEVVFRLDAIDTDEVAFDNFVKNNLDSEYVKVKHPQNVLDSTIQITYELATARPYDMGIISKSLDDNFNGDNYLFYRKEDELYIALCDGMGHGAKAAECSKYLISALDAHLNLNSDFSDMIQDLNNLLLFRNGTDNYSTLDLAKINLSSLKARVLKAGAFLSYVIRDQKVYKVKKHNLPLGIVAECDFEINELNLKKGDILVLTTDGLGQEIEKDAKVLLMTPGVSMDQLARNIYNTLTNKKKVNDDCTIITIKLL